VEFNGATKRTQKSCGKKAELKVVRPSGEDEKKEMERCAERGGFYMRRPSKALESTPEKGVKRRGVRPELDADYRTKKARHGEEPDQRSLSEKRALAGGTYQVEKYGQMG